MTCPILLSLKKKYGLMYNIREPSQAINKAVELCLESDNKSKWRLKREKVFNDKIDVTNLIIDSVLKHS